MGTGLDGLSVATNVLLNARFGWRESNAIRIEYVAKARATPPEEREEYIKFLKWAAAYDRSGGFKTWDGQLIELDSSWRTNQLRRRSIEAQQGRPTTPTGTNIFAELLHDYELATGLRQPEPQPELLRSVMATPDVPSTTNVVSTSAPSAVPSEDPSSAPTPRSRRGVVVFGSVLLVLLVTVVWHRRHSRRHLL